MRDDSTAACCAPGRTARAASTPTSRITPTCSEALLTLYESSFDARWFDAARETAEAMIERFADPEHGGFFTTSHDHEELVARRKDVDDHPIPSGNSAAAFGLLRLSALTGEHSYERHAVSVFRLLHGVAARHPQAVAHLLRAIDFHLAEVKEVALVWPQGADAAELAEVVRSRLRPHMVLAGGEEGTERPELMAGRHGARRIARRIRLREASPAGRRSRARTSSLGCSTTRPDRVPSMATASKKPAKPKKKAASAKETATAYFDAIKDRDLEAMAACWKPGSLDHLYGMATLRVPEDLQGWFGGLFRAFPDFVMEVTDMVAYGDKAAVRWHATGTFSGPGKFEGLSPTGASIELEGLDLLTISDGEIVENRAYTNATEMARQLGAMPPAGSAGEKAMLGAVNARTAAAAAIKRFRER